MNRLIIVGNGFDLSLGLKTSYKDFLYNYIKNSYIKVYKDVENDSITTSIDLKTQSYRFNDGLIELRCPTNDTSHTIKGPLSQLFDYNSLTDYLISNKILSYQFELLDEIHNHLNLINWVDIEILYYDILVSIVKRNKEYPTRENLIHEYNKKFNLLRLEMIKYLSSLTPSWEKMENEKYNFDVISNYKYNFFNRLFETTYNKTIEEIMFLNFNYTYTIQSIDKFFPVDVKYDINYIHGELNDKSSVIFGFGDELDENFSLLESLRGNESLEYIKQSYYSTSSNYKKLKSFIKKKQYEVYILGHSCGSSDKTLLNEIFENELCKSIRIFYHQIDETKTDEKEKSMEILKRSVRKTELRDKIVIDMDNKMGGL